MARLHEHLKYFVNMKISTDKSWQGITVYLSGHEVTAFYSSFIEEKGYLMEKYKHFLSYRHQVKESIKLWNSSDQKKQSLIMIQTQGTVSMA